MAEPEEIIDWLDIFFKQPQQLTGKKVLVTAGPTYEALDPVRFIGNNSSGKMGGQKFSIRYLKSMVYIIKLLFVFNLISCHIRSNLVNSY